jgi:hypothetical protein
VGVAVALSLRYLKVGEHPERVNLTEILTNQKNGTARALLLHFAEYDHIRFLRDSLSHSLGAVGIEASRFRQRNQASELRKAFSSGGPQFDLYYVFVDETNTRRTQEALKTVERLVEHDSGARILIATPKSMRTGDFRKYSSNGLDLNAPAKCVSAFQAGYGSGNRSASAAIAEALARSRNPKIDLALFTTSFESLEGRLADVKIDGLGSLSAYESLSAILKDRGNKLDLGILAAADSAERKIALDGNLELAEKQSLLDGLNGPILDQFLREIFECVDYSGDVVVVMNPQSRMSIVPKIAGELGVDISRSRIVGPAAEVYRTQNALAHLFNNFIANVGADMPTFDAEDVHVENILGQHHDFILAPELISVRDRKTGLVMPASVFYNSLLRSAALSDARFAEADLGDKFYSGLDHEDSLRMKSEPILDRLSILNENVRGYSNRDEMVLWVLAELLVQCQAERVVQWTGTSDKVLPPVMTDLVEYMSGVKDGSVCATYLARADGSREPVDARLNPDFSYVPRFHEATYKGGELVGLSTRWSSISEFTKARYLDLEISENKLGTCSSEAVGASNGG